MVRSLARRAASPLRLAAASAAASALEAPAVLEAPVRGAAAVTEVPARGAPIPEASAHEEPAAPVGPARGAPSITEKNEREEPAVAEVPAREASSIPEAAAHEDPAAPAPEPPADARLPASPRRPARCAMKERPTLPDFRARPGAHPATRRSTQTGSARPGRGTERRADATDRASTRLPTADGGGPGRRSGRGRGRCGADASHNAPNPTAERLWLRSPSRSRTDRAPRRRSYWGNSRADKRGKARRHRRPSGCRPERRRCPRWRAES